MSGISAVDPRLSKIEPGFCMFFVHFVHRGCRRCMAFDLFRTAFLCIVPKMLWGYCHLRAAGVWFPHRYSFPAICRRIPQDLTIFEQAGGF